MDSAKRLCRTAPGLLFFLLLLLVGFFLKKQWYFKDTVFCILCAFLRNKIWIILAHFFIFITWHIKFTYYKLHMNTQQFIDVLQGFVPSGGCKNDIVWILRFFFSFCAYFFVLCNQNQYFAFFLLFAFFAFFRPFFAFWGVLYFAPFKLHLLRALYYLPYLLFEQYFKGAEFFPFPATQKVTDFQAWIITYQK